MNGDDIETRDGVMFYDAPLPRLFHLCKVWTRGWFGLECIERCACGARRVPHIGGGWRGRNERRTWRLFPDRTADAKRAEKERYFQKRMQEIEARLSPLKSNQPAAQ